MPGGRSGSSSSPSAGSGPIVGSGIGPRLASAKSPFNVFACNAAWWSLCNFAAGPEALASTRPLFRPAERGEKSQATAKEIAIKLKRNVHLTTLCISLFLDDFGTLIVTIVDTKRAITARLQAYRTLNSG